MACLDSHTNLGAMTNVRLDSHLHPARLEEAIARLSDRGLLVVSYLVLDQNQGYRLYAAARRVSEQRPRAFVGAFGSIFVTGPGLEGATRGHRRRRGEDGGVPGRSEGRGTGDRTTSRSSTCRSEAYPFSYLIVIGILLALSTLMVRSHLRCRSCSTRRPGCSSSSAPASC